MARASRVLGQPDYLEAAKRCAEFILAEMRDDRERLLHSWRQGRAKLTAYLDDYAYFTNALVTIYENDWDPIWLERAVSVAEQMIAPLL